MRPDSQSVLHYLGDDTTISCLLVGGLRIVLGMLMKAISVFQFVVRRHTEVGPD